MTALFSLWFGFGLFAGASVEIEVIPQPESSVFILPTTDEEMPFVVQNNAIVFSQTKTPAEPCYYTVGGQVFDFNGAPFTAFDVHIEQVNLEAGVEPERDKAHTFEGIWSSVFDGQAGYNVWMTIKGTEERISPIITVPGRDCDQNEATINFVQVRPVDVPATLEIEVDTYSSDEDLPFVLQNNTLIYSHKDTLDRPCNRIIEGYIYTIDGKPNVELVVNSTMLDDSFEPPKSYWIPYADSEVDSGPSKWGSLLPTAQWDYYVWLSQSVDGEPISPEIRVEHLGCDYNVVTINFVQVRPIE